MADPYERTEPTVAGTAESSVNRPVRVSGQSDQREADYQAELERLRADITKLAQSVSGSVRQKMQPMGRELEAVVTRNPTASVAIAAGLGLLLGFMMSRR